MFSTLLTYAFEAPLKVRAGFVGCGGQAFRNILPTFQYAPVELVATCDVDKVRAEAYARQFGARANYRDYREMLEKEKLDAVFFATGYDEGGRPRYPEQASYAMRAGCHVWIEKPPAASVAEIEQMQAVSRETGRKVGVGFMKMFSPGVGKVHSIINSAGFGAPTSFYLRDPEKLPPREKRKDLNRMQFFLDHLAHPASIIQFLMGPLKRFYLEEGPDGEPIFTMKFLNNACGVLHMPWGQSGTCPKERLEVVGQGANVVLENNVRLTYYRPGHRGLGKYEYGRIGDYIGADEHAPLHWEMDGYSGQPYNMHIFYQGYAQEVMYFCRCVLDDEPVRVGGLEDAWHIIRFFEACQTAEHLPIEFTDQQPVTKEQA
jgi:predicted dehydrogenase